MMARGHHDIGGLPGAGTIDQSQHELADWEILADAVNQALGARGVKRTDELRRLREEMDAAAYQNSSYYERWIASMEGILIEKKILTRDEIDRKLAEFEKKWGEP
jgi:Nitrile hydratase beta subunit